MHQRGPPAVPGSGDKRSHTAEELHHFLVKDQRCLFGDKGANRCGAERFRRAGDPLTASAQGGGCWDGGGRRVRMALGCDKGMGEARGWGADLPQNQCFPCSSESGTVWPGRWWALSGGWRAQPCGLLVSSHPSQPRDRRNACGNRLQRWECSAAPPEFSQTRRQDNARPPADAALLVSRRSRAGPSVSNRSSLEMKKQ